MLARLFCLALFVLAPSFALAQSSLDWSDNLGGITAPATDEDGDAYPATARMDCRVEIPGKVVANLTGLAPGETRTFGSIPKGGPSTATGTCRVDLVPGVDSDADSQPVILRLFKRPSRPALQS